MARKRTKTASKEASRAEGIRTLRERLGLTQGKLAELVGVHAMTVSKWERGQLAPAPYQAAILAALGRAAGDKRTVDAGVEALGAYLNQALIDTGGADALRLSASNQLRGRVVALEMDGIMARVVIEIAPRVRLTSLITRASVERLGLAVGGEAVAVIKATEVLVGVAAESS